MKCPYCGETDNKVTDSRLSGDNEVIRRRRECLKCGDRFTTRETIDKLQLTIVKKDGRREFFSKDKLSIGINKACEKRRISVNETEEFINKLEKELRESGEKEIPSDSVGKIVMDWLHNLDEVAYVRFASVYRNFKDASDFLSELASMKR